VHNPKIKKNHLVKRKIVFIGEKKFKPDIDFIKKKQPLKFFKKTNCLLSSL
jgi:hypothetical protein